MSSGICNAFIPIVNLLVQCKEKPWIQRYLIQNLALRPGHGRAAIVIAGYPAAGKTTLCNAIGRRDAGRQHVYLELLPPPNITTEQKEIFFLVQSLVACTIPNAIVERPPNDHIILAFLHFCCGALTLKEWQNCKNIYCMINAYIPQPGIEIILNIDYSTALLRLKQRNEVSIFLRPDVFWRYVAIRKFGRYP